MPILSSHPPEQVGQEVIDAGGPPPVRPQKRNCPQVRSPRSELPSKKRHLDHSSSSPVHHSNPRPRRRVIREDSDDFNFCLQMPDATGYEEPCQGQGNSFEESPPPSLHSEQQWDSDKLKEEHQSDDKSHECASSREEQDNEGPEEFTSHSLGPDLQQYTELQAQFTALEAQRNGEIREGIINHNDDGIVDIDTYQADQERQASSMDEDPLTSLRQSSVTVQDLRPCTVELYERLWCSKIAMASVSVPANGPTNPPRVAPETQPGLTNQKQHNCVRIRSELPSNIEPPYLPHLLFSERSPSQHLFDMQFIKKDHLCTLAIGCVQMVNIDAWFCTHFSHENGEATSKLVEVHKAYADQSPKEKAKLVKRVKTAVDLNISVNARNATAGPSATASSSKDKTKAPAQTNERP
ncbi:hypothetical protein H4Q26_009135 [Puccinia striiformis f. sp. tritici PST-130]|nr:hypothetical protein H4Q26_009135 [Puccinia striiformis f. sp. tritici PST-130]